MSTQGVKLYCDTKVIIHHYHAHRSRLAELYIDTPDRAYYKSKHRILLVHTIAKSRLQLLVFYTIGIWGHTFWLCLHIFFYAPVTRWISLFLALIRGTLDALRLVWSRC